MVPFRDFGIDHQSLYGTILRIWYGPFQPLWHDFATWVRTISAFMARCCEFDKGHKGKNWRNKHVWIAALYVNQTVIFKKRPNTTQID